MAATKSIKQRIKSVKNTSQITKAMEVVSATKMRRSQEFAIRARPYALKSFELMQNLLTRVPHTPVLLSPREVKNSCLLLIASDKGLAGAFNANVLKKAEAWITEKRTTAAPFTVITVGKKALEFAERRNIAPAASFADFGDYTTPDETLPVAERAITGFLDGTWDELYAAYTHFRTTLLQESSVKKILPASRESIADVVNAILPERGRFTEKAEAEASRQFNYEYKFEPSEKEILDRLVYQLIRIHIHHIILESNASEHSARMVAMKHASDNARDLITDLTLAFNKARQAGITRELTEITAGREALEN